MPSREESRGDARSARATNADRCDAIGRDPGREADARSAEKTNEERLDQAAVRASPLPNRFDTQRPHSDGWAASRPTSSR